MITAGVDVGTRFLKICIVEDERIIGFSCHEMNRAFDLIYKQALSEAIEMAGIKKRSLQRILSTGYGAHLVKKASVSKGEHFCVSKGLFLSDNKIRTVIDVGGFFIRVVTLNEEGIPRYNYVNEKCAAGSGKFLEMISEAVEIPFDKVSEYASQSKNMFTLTSSCAVFAESDIISQLNSGKSANDIIASVINSISSKVFTLFNNADAKDVIALTGGLTRVSFFVSELEKMLNVKLAIPDLDPQLAAAYGAALVAREENSGKKRFFFFPRSLLDIF